VTVLLLTWAFTVFVFTPPPEALALGVLPRATLPLMVLPVMLRFGDAAEPRKESPKSSSSSMPPPAVPKEKTVSARWRRRVLLDTERPPARAAMPPPRPEPVSPKIGRPPTGVPPRDWLPLSVLRAMVSVGVAVVKKTPVPMAPPVAVPLSAKVAVLALALPWLPPWSRLLFSVLSVTVTEPPSFQPPPPPATPRRVVMRPPAMVPAAPTKPPLAPRASLPVNVL